MGADVHGGVQVMMEMLQAGVHWRAQQARGGPLPFLLQPPRASAIARALHAAQPPPLLGGPLLDQGHQPLGLPAPPAPPAAQPVALAALPAGAAPLALAAEAAFPGAAAAVIGLYGAEEAREAIGSHMFRCIQAMGGVAAARAGKITGMLLEGLGLVGSLRILSAQPGLLEENVDEALRVLDEAAA